MATTPLSVSSDLLLGWASTRTSARGGAASSATVGTTTAKVKAPWEDTKHLTPASELVNKGLSGKLLFDPSAKNFTTPNATDDERKLFALHAGINTLAALAGRFDQAGVTSAEQARLSAAFDAGLHQLDSFLSTQKFDALSVLRGAKTSQAVSQAAVGAAKSSYTTGVIARGNPDAENAAFAGDLSFHIDAVDAKDQPQSVDIDLAGMGATPRSLNNVVSFVNRELRAAGLSSHFSAVKQGASSGQDQYGLKLDVSVGESLSFSAAAAAPAMYMSTAANRLAKIADPTGGVATSGINSPNVVFDKLIAKGATIHASATDADGSLYVVADATQTAENQAIKGVSDAVLYKYDTAGNMIYARTLGASGAANGYSLAVSDDGDVAIAGSATGSLGDGATAKATGADGFVTVFNSAGVEQWTAREKTSLDGENTAVAFGANGTVYVGGRQKNLTGDWQSTLKTYSSTGVLRDTQNLGVGDGVRGLAVEDLGASQRVTIAGIESGKAVLRQFDDTGAAVTVGAVRDLGGLGGGDLVGLKLDGGDLYLAGNTRIGGLSAGSTASVYSGGQDGFVAKLSGDLTAGAGERVSYIGGAGDDHIAGFGISAGKIWVGGDSDKTFGGVEALGKRDGFVSRLGVSGATEWVQRLSGGADGYKASSFTLDEAGTTALDRLGLPQGDVELKDAKDLISGSSVRVGDQFSVSVNGRVAQTITIKAGDTVQTLADRVNKVLLSGGKAGVKIGLEDGDNLKISALGSNRIELRSGPAGKDALAGLGIEEGVVIADAPVSAKVKKKPNPIYGLGVPSGISLADKISRKQAVDDLGLALGTIQKAFRVLTTPASTARTATGPAPAYLQKQLANYQAALARLSSG